MNDKKIDAQTLGTLLDVLPRTVGDKATIAVLKQLANGESAIEPKQHEPLSKPKEKPKVDMRGKNKPNKWKPEEDRIVLTGLRNRASNETLLILARRLQAQLPNRTIEAIRSRIIAFVSGRINKKTVKASKPYRKYKKSKSNYDRWTYEQDKALLQFNEDTLKWAGNKNAEIRKYIKQFAPGRSLNAVKIRLWAYETGKLKLTEQVAQ